MAGQSNMEGYGLVSTAEDCWTRPDGTTKCRDYNLDNYTLDALVDSGAEEYQHLQDANGSWVTRQDVNVEHDGYSHKLDETTPLTVDLGIGTPHGGAHPDSVFFGPELQFGHVVVVAFDFASVLAVSLWQWRVRRG
eukprot:scaffold33566_cov46-Phaeocystis_antarctica.AAC.2